MAPMYARAPQLSTDVWHAPNIKFCLTLWPKNQVHLGIAPLDSLVSCIAMLTIENCHHLTLTIIITASSNNNKYTPDSTS